jgi:hypothetical protein
LRAYVAAIRVSTAAVFLTAGTGQVSAAVYYVGGRGASDKNPGTASRPFATIQKAATVAKAGDVIRIRAGTYRETVIPANSGSEDKPIVFEPDGDAVVIVSGADPVEEGWTVGLGRRHHLVDGLVHSSDQHDRVFIAWADRVSCEGWRRGIFRLLLPDGKVERT